MDTVEYFSLITTRINELQEELKEIQREKQRYLKTTRRHDGKIGGDKKAQSYQLQIEFMNDKIQYLKKFEALPHYLLITKCLNEDALLKIGKTMGYHHCTPETVRTALMIMFGVEKITYLMKELENLPNLNPIKFDFDLLIKLIAFQNRDKKLANKQEELKQKIMVPNYINQLTQFSVSNNGESYLSFYELEKLKNELTIYEQRLCQAMTKVDSFYQFETIKKISDYRSQSKLHLPIEFVQFHQERVLAKFPELKNDVKTFYKNEKSKENCFLKLCEKLGFLKKVNMRPFLDGILECYYNDEMFSMFDIDSHKIFDLSETDYETILHQIHLKNQKRNIEIQNLQSKTQRLINEHIEKVVEYDVLREREKNKFMKQLHYHNIEEIDCDYLWQLPNLKQYCKRIYCYQELQNLLLQLSTAIKKQDTSKLLETSYQLYKK